MKRTILTLLFSLSLTSPLASAQTVSGTAGQSAPGNKTDDQPSNPPAKAPRGKANRKRSDATTIPPAKQPGNPMDPSMPSDPKTPTSPTAPRTPVKPTDPTRPEDPTKPVVPPPTK